MVKIVLASKSPRRQELLSNIGVDFTVFTQDVDESVDRSFSPRKTVEILAERKCLASVKKLSPGSVVISADTVVSADGKIFGKPRDKQDAYNMLRSLSGQWHEVLTGIAVSDGEKTVVESEVSKVCFRPLTDDEILKYIDTNEFADKAGGYGIQELGCLFVDKIEGDYFNIVGLPIGRLMGILKRTFEYDILDLMAKKHKHLNEK